MEQLKAYRTCTKTMTQHKFEQTVKIKLPLCIRLKKPETIPDHLKLLCTWLSFHVYMVIMYIWLSF